jgi:hypothetical protein
VGKLLFCDKYHCNKGKYIMAISTYKLTHHQRDILRHEEADTRKADAFFKSAGVDINLPNANLYSKAHALLCATVHGVGVLNKADAKYVAQFKRHWKATSGKVTSKNKKRILTIIKIYSQRQQNKLLREKRLTCKQKML